MDLFHNQEINEAKYLLKRILGILAGLSFLGLSVLFVILVAACFLLSEPAAGIICLILCAIFGWLSFKFFSWGRRSRQMQQLAVRLQDYKRIERGVEYFAIADLASECGEDVSTTRNNLKKMKAVGMLPGVTFDRSMTTVLLTDHARTLYRQAMQSYQQRKLQEQMEAARAGSGSGQDLQTHQEMPQNKSSDEQVVLHADEKGAEAVSYSADSARGKDSKDSHLQSVLQSGYSYSRKIREINDMIPDTDEMSIKLYRLENVVSGIFREVDHNPKQVRQTRKLTDYYLPTIMKLLSDYMRILDKPYRSSEDVKTQSEIESAVDQASDAFEKLYSRMTQINTIDIESDISVMQHMMEQDGLKNSDMAGVH